MNKTTEMAMVALFGVFCYFMYSVYKEYVEQMEAQGPPKFDITVNGEVLENLILDLYNKLKQEPAKETE